MQRGDQKEYTRTQKETERNWNERKYPRYRHRKP